MGSDLMILADAAEQAAWLNDLLALPSVWCWAKTGDNGAWERVHQINGETAITGHPSRARTLYLGTVSLVPQPLWIEFGGRQQMDVTRSQVVSITPAVVEHECLLAGSISIMHPRSYRQAGIDPVGVGRWYKEVQKGMADRAVQGAQLLVRSPTAADAPLQHPIVVTRAAVDWLLSGRCAKQFSESVVEFVLKAPTATPIEKR